MDFKKLLLKWYVDNQRDLPWRNTSKAYFIWVSEIILQQTRVVQGIGYYHRFIKAFPTINELAKANEDEVLKVWQGLGYYSRARNLHKSAKHLVEKFGGELPKSYEELLKIKGIGAYSAGAIASFAYKKPVPAIDGNVYRIIARVFGLFASPFTAAGKREFFQLVNDLMDKDSPNIFNQALLDFGALQCVPQSPNCAECPFAHYCYAYSNNMIKELPVKAKKIIPRDRFFTYLLIRFGNKTFITKRKSNDIWKSLYEFPLIESAKLPKPQEILALPEWRTLFNGIVPKVVFLSQPVKHKLSHQTLYSQFVIVKIDRVNDFLVKNFKTIQTDSVSNYSTPKLIENFLAAEPATKYFLSKPHRV